MKRKIAKIILTLGITISVAGWSQNLVGAAEPEETEQDALMVSSTLASQVDDGVAGETEIRNGITYTLKSDNSAYYEVSDCDVSVEYAEILGRVEGFNVTEIDGTAFDDCTNLVSVSVPDTEIEGLGVCHFKNCRNLNRIEVSPNNAKYCSIDGVVYSKDKTQILRYPTGKNGSYSIPEGTIHIGHAAFARCIGIIDVSCPSSVTSIGVEAFYSSGLKSIDVSGEINEIEERTFYNCLKLETISLPNTVRYIKRGAFDYCSSLKNISLPNTVEDIESYAFADCKSLKTISMPSTVQYIGDRAFQDCTSLNNVTIPGSVGGIEYRTFYNCTSLSNVTIQDGVKTIDNSAFYNCGLKRIDIPATVISLGCFSNCLDLQEIRVDENNPNYKTVDGVLYNKDMTTLIRCPAGNNVDNFIVQEKIKQIGVCAFYYSKVKNVVLPDGLESIGDRAFGHCVKLQKIILPNSLKSIGDEVFLGCSELGNAVLSENLESIGNIAFSGCCKLQNIVLPESLESIGASVFSDSEIEEISIPSKISVLKGFNKILGSYEVFDGAKKLKRIDVVDSNPYYASYEGCVYTKDMKTLVCCPKGKEKVKIYKETKEISSWAFRDCDNLQTVNLPESVDNFQAESFTECDNLKKVIIPNSTVSFHYDDCFYNCPKVIICSNPGSKAEQYAKENGLKYGPIPEHVHSYESEITKEPTCTEKGVKTYSCQECDSSYTEEIPMVAHVFETVTDANGITQEKCRVCGKIKPSSGSAENTETEGTEPTEIIENEEPENIIRIVNIKLTAPSAKLAAGKKVKLTASVFPLNASNKNLKWSSSNKKYATVDQTGRVALKLAGTGKKVTITAIAQDGSNVKAIYKITVMKHAVKSVKIKAPAKAVKAGKSVQLKAVVKTTGKKVNKTMAWSTSNKKYATVDKKGFVKTKKAGKGKSVTITVQSTDGTNKKATIKIKIK